jgi:large subunit ribosomal protein L9
MKLLLLEDIERLGWLGDIVFVKTGYARNYLIPQGLATVPSEENIQAIAEEKAHRAEQRRLARAKLEKVVEVVNGAEAVIASKANEQGHLFGSVAERDIAENLRAQGFEIADDMVQLDGHLKEVGTHEVTIKVAHDLLAMVKVIVVSQDEAEKSIESDTEHNEESEQ